MQKALNTHWLTLYSLWQRLLISKKTGALAGLVLLLAGLANPAGATGFKKDFVIANGNYYYALGGGTPQIQGKDFGTFDRGSGSLVLGGEANTETTSSDDVLAPQMYYRVYLTGSTPGGFTPLNLTNRRNGIDGPNSQRWDNTVGPNLISNTNGPGAGVNASYTLEIYFQGTGTYNNSGGSGSFPFYDSNNSNNYKATFTVTGTVPTTWNSVSSDGDWFNKANWSTNKVPDYTTDVVIPFNTNARYPTINNPAPGGGYGLSAQVRDLRIEGTTAPNTNQSVRGAILTLGNTRLQVYGNFIDDNAGFVQSQNGGLFSLSGVNQQFSGGTFIDFSLEGGGTKTLLGKMTVTFRVQCINGKLKTEIGSPDKSGVDLSGDNARIEGENESSYVDGIIRAISMPAVVQGTPSYFGNIGVDLTTRDGSPGVITVTRYTRVYEGANNHLSINRNFVFSPSGANSSVRNFDLVFHYLDVDRNNGSYTIAPDNLRLFRSAVGGIPFRPLSKSSNDPAAKTLTRLNIDLGPDADLFALYTLGDNTLPLPVTVTSFAAVAQGSNAVLTWTTAQEVNSKGFEVQVSGDGTTFRKLGFVASATPNSSETRTYKYSDTEAGKQGTRYYRLRQLDVDGKGSFFGPQAVTFGASALTSVQGYPNPFGSEINLALQTTTAGPATVSVFDGVGRQVRLVQPTLAAGASNLRLGDLQSLPHGLYVVQVRYSDGQTQRLKVIKE